MPDLSLRRGRQNDTEIEKHGQKELYTFTGRSLGRVKDYLKQKR